MKRQPDSTAALREGAWLRAIPDETGIVRLEHWFVTGPDTALNSRTVKRRPIAELIREGGLWLWLGPIHQTPSTPDGL